MLKKSKLNFGLMALSSSIAASSLAAPTNIVLITVDDLGYKDLSSFGSTDIPTPFIDSIAESGVKFTSAYVTAPLCGPSRAGFITGQYQQKVGVDSNPNEKGPDLSAPRLSQVLQGGGYKTAIIGKWHLGTDKEYLPNQTGFDYFWGTPTWGHYFLPPTVEEIAAGGDSWMRSRRDSYDPTATFTQGLGNQQRSTTAQGSGSSRARADFLANSYNNLWRNGDRITSLEYMTDEISREAVEFIDRSKEGPFFIHVSYNAPHTPLQATQRYLDRFLHIPETEGRRLYAAMVSAVDDGVGRVLHKLDKEGLRENTLIVFFSDNGGANYSDEPEERSRFYIEGTRTEKEYSEKFGKSHLRWGRAAEQRIGANGAQNGPLRYGKGTLHEGGIRVPFLLSWPSRIPAGKVVEYPISALDLFPTAVAAAELQLPENVPFDGKDLTPFLTGNVEGIPHQTLFWRYQQAGAVRDGDWKLIRIGEEKTHLYNLAENLGESDNLAERFPEKLEELNNKWVAWNSTLPPPPAPPGSSAAPAPVASNNEQLPLPNNPELAEGNANSTKLPVSGGH